MVKSDSDDYSEDSGLENYAEEDNNLKKDIMQFGQKGSTPSDEKTAQTGITPVPNSFAPKATTPAPGKTVN